MNISQIYTLEQQVQSTSYPHYLHLSCNVKLKVTVLLHLKKITSFFYDFLLKKTFAKEKNINKLTNERKRNLFHIKGSWIYGRADIFKELNQSQQAKKSQI